MTDAPPEPDRHPGAPHPRETTTLVGQDAAEAGFLAAWQGGRLHHAWLITGPRGAGKATLAWRMARALLATPPAAGPPTTLDIAAEDPVARRVQAGSEGRLFVLRRGWDDKTRRLRAQITVDETRAMRSFFSLSAVDGGRRVVIVDAADEMNANAANAVLKMLEEPPAGAILLLVSHQPARLLPTIRSRCRELRCAALGADDLALALAATGAGADASAAALAELAGGSVAAALDLAEGGGDALYARLMALLSGMPDLNRAAAVALADAAGGRNAGVRDLTLRLIDLCLIRLARTGAGHPPAAEAAPGESAQLARLAPDPDAGRRWATLQQALSTRGAHGVAVNLDPSSLILDMLLKVNDTAAAILARP